jgi:ComF family protein
MHPLTKGESVLCLHCSLNLPKTRYHHLTANETTLRLAGRFRFEQASSFLYFSKEGMTQKLLHQMKYEGRKQLAVYLATLFAKELNDCGWFDTIDALLPVPLHPKKENKRGYNQSMLLAKGIATISQKEILAGVLKRSTFTETQTHKSRSERLENLSRAFSLKEITEAKNKHILLIDDVLTTGATIEACALHLSQIPGVRLSVATLAVAL